MNYFKKYFGLFLINISRSERHCVILMIFLFLLFIQRSQTSLCDKEFHGGLFLCILILFKKKYFNIRSKIYRLWSLRCLFFCTWNTYRSTYTMDVKGGESTDWLTGSLSMGGGVGVGGSGQQIFLNLHIINWIIMELSPHFLGVRKKWNEYKEMQSEIEVIGFWRLWKLSFLFLFFRLSRFLGWVCGMSMWWTP